MAEPVCRNDKPPDLPCQYFHQTAFSIGYTDASEQGTGGVWIDPNKDSTNFSWQVKWLADIVRQLVSFTNPVGTLTKPVLELASLVLHEAVVSSISTSPACQTPTLGSNNNPTVA